MVSLDNVAMSRTDQGLAPDQPAHCIATDQTGKQKVVVTSTMLPRGSKSSDPRPLRFVIMTNVKQDKSRRPRRRKQLPKSSTLTSQDRVWHPPDPSTGIGNPATDNMNSFPIENSRTVTIAIDFVIKHMMPGRSKGSQQDQIPTIFLPFLRLGMENQYLFESIVALALSYRYNDMYGQSKLTPDIAYHYGRAMAFLRNLLASPTAYVDDAAIMTTIFLADLATKFGTSAEVTAHAAALQNMIISRGGLDCLGQDGLLKSMIEYVSTIGDLPGVSKDDELPTPSEPATSRSKTLPDPSTLMLPLEYPKHPYSPEICSIIANLPEGFRELALNGHLSVEVITLIDLAQRQLFSNTGDRIIQLKDYCPATIIMHAKRYLSISKRLTESIVCLSIMLISMRSFCYRFSPQKYLFPKKLLLLARDRGMGEASQEQYEHFVWTVLLTAEACQCQPLVTYTEPLMEQIFGPTARHEDHSENWLGDWTALRKVMKKFLWGRDLMHEWRDRWEAEMRRLRAEAPT